MRIALRSTSEVFHYWANQVQSEGRAASVFFEGPKLYSYGRHFCIARILPSGVVAFTTRDYSVTTSKHKSQARSAARHLRTVYCNDPSDNAQANTTHARHAIRDALHASTRKGTRYTTRDAHKARALRIAEDANVYLAALPADERQGVLPLDTTDLEKVREHLDAIEAAEKRLREEQHAARLADLQSSLAEWRAGVILSRSGLSALPVALRINTDATEVQTSHGASIPLADALKLWPIIERVRASEHDYEPGAPVGPYSLTKIRRDGSLVVGCHDIAYAEVSAIADALRARGVL